VIAQGLGPGAGTIARRREGEAGQEMTRNELMRKRERIAETTVRMVIFFFWKSYSFRLEIVEERRFSYEG
jgi:hypothetical protein